jgi:hypothetical protein
MDGSVSALLGGRAFRYRTVRRLLPYAVRHTTWKPFRRTPQARSATARISSAEFERAAHDMYCEMLLNGYRRATSTPAADSTGLAIVLFMVFVFTFDQEFERARQVGDPTDHPTLLGLPRVAEIWSALREYLRIFGRDEAVIGYLTELFEHHYDHYRRDVEAAATSGDFDTTRVLVERDSGLPLRAVYEIIRLFNNHENDSGCARQFHTIGIAGKFLDDIRDMADDVAARNPNLLYALSMADARDHRTLRAALRAHTPVTIWWWARNCPTTLTAYFRHIYRYYDDVTHPDLRLPLDVCLTLLHSRRYWRRPIQRRPQAIR